MGIYVKKLINFRFDRCKATETILEGMAAKGLLLHTCGSLFWTFKKEEPQKLKFAISYFPEGSIYDPEISSNQQAYLDHAAATGWNLVTQHHQMHIFCNNSQHPVPFEADEKEKLDHIKACMRKSFVPSMLVLIVVFTLNLLMNFKSLSQDSIGYLSNRSWLLSVFMNVTVLIYEIYSLLNYFIWCKRSEQQIAAGGTCVANTRLVYKVIDTVFIGFMFGCLTYFLYYLMFDISWLWLLLCVMQMPILLLLFGSSIKFWKKVKASATINKILSITALIVGNCIYLSFLFLFVMKLGFSAGIDSNYRTVTWPITATEHQEYRLYQDSIPLTCADLYGETSYEFYSYECDISSTFLLTQTWYRQDAPPAKDAPPRIAYRVLETPHSPVYARVKKQLLTVPKWQENTSFHAIDNAIWGTIEAYQEYHNDLPTGDYLMLFKDKIITLSLETPITDEQVSVIKEKLLVVND